MNDFSCRLIRWVIARGQVRNETINCDNEIVECQGFEKLPVFQLVFAKWFNKLVLSRKMATKLLLNKLICYDIWNYWAPYLYRISLFNLLEWKQSTCIFLLLNIIYLYKNCHKCTFYLNRLYVPTFAEVKSKNCIYWKDKTRLRRSYV